MIINYHYNQKIKKAIDLFVCSTLRIVIRNVTLSRRCRSKKECPGRNLNLLCQYFSPKHQIRWRHIKKNYSYWSLGYPARALSVDQPVEALPEILSI